MLRIPNSVISNSLSYPDDSKLEYPRLVDGSNTSYLLPARTYTSGKSIAIPASSNFNAAKIATEAFPLGGVDSVVEYSGWASDGAEGYFSRLARVSEVAREGAIDSMRLYVSSGEEMTEDVIAKLLLVKERTIKDLNDVKYSIPRRVYDLHSIEEFESIKSKVALAKTLKPENQAKALKEVAHGITYARSGVDISSDAIEVSSRRALKAAKTSKVLLVVSLAPSVFKILEGVNNNNYRKVAEGFGELAGEIAGAAVSGVAGGAATYAIAIVLGVSAIGWIPITVGLVASIAAGLYFGESHQDSVVELVSEKLEPNIIVP